MMPFGAVFLGLVFYALLVFCLRKRFYAMNSAYGFLKINLWLRYAINFFLPLMFYAAMTIRDKDINKLFADGEWQLAWAIVTALTLMFLFAWSAY